MTAAPVLIDIDAHNLDDLPCCGIKNLAHPGRRLKHCWLQSQFNLGLRAKTLLAPDGEPCGYLEYIPGEYAWRGVDAGGYMFIHCLWNQSRRYQRKQWGTAMLEACLNDAKSSGMIGVAAIARDGPWLAGRSIFLANGFQLVEHRAPRLSTARSQV